VSVKPTLTPAFLNAVSDVSGEGNTNLGSFIAVSGVSVKEF